MMDVAPADVERARLFAEEVDAISRRGAAPDCAERMEAINVEFDAECVRLGRQPPDAQRQRKSSAAKR